MNEMDNPKHPVEDWYDRHVDFEDQRLDLGRLELAVTTECIQRLIRDLQNQPSAHTPLQVADIGCGTGRYAIPLAKDGLDLTICDISSSEVELAKQRAQAEGVQFRAAIPFDATRLRQHPQLYRKDHFDVALWLGPFYHILDDAERADTLLTALETVRPGGYLVVAFVTRNAHLRDVATRDPSRLATESDFYSFDEYLKHGRYTRGSGPPMHHTTPTQIHELLAVVEGDGGPLGVAFEFIRMVSCEGFLGFQHASSLAGLDEGTFGKWLEIILHTAADEQTFAAADHLLVILRRRT